MDAGAGAASLSSVHALGHATALKLRSTQLEQVSGAFRCESHGTDSFARE